MEMITVVSAICGSGKTSWAGEEMEANSHKRWLYICPILSEVERIIQDCPKCDFQQPDDSKKDEWGNKILKSEDIYELAKLGVNIASTHELFKELDRDTLNMFKKMGYNLILDEVIEVVQSLPKFNKKEVDKLFEDGYLSEEPFDNANSNVKKIVVGDETKIANVAYIKGMKDRKGKYMRLSTLRKYAENNKLVKVNGEALLWLFPMDIFEDTFQSAYILTYLFEGSYLKHLLDIYGMDYESCSVKGEYGQGFELIDEDLELERQYRAKLKGLLNIYDGRDLNQVGSNAHTVLSKNWWLGTSRKDRTAKELDMSKKIRNYFYTRLGLRSVKLTLWSCFKVNQYNSKTKSGINPKDFLTYCISCNQRATNNYRVHRYLAYVINVYMNTMVYNFFKAFNIHEVNDGTFAVSQLLQWLFRSRLRDWKSIDLYLPSVRMRALLDLYLNEFDSGSGVEKLIK
jgi:hypothetical protein